MGTSMQHAGLIAFPRSWPTRKPWERFLHLSANRSVHSCLHKHTLSTTWDVGHASSFSPSALRCTTSSLVGSGPRSACVARLVWRASSSLSLRPQVCAAICCPCGARQQPVERIFLNAPLTRRGVATSSPLLATEPISSSETNVAVCASGACTGEAKETLLAQVPAHLQDSLKAFWADAGCRQHSGRLRLLFVSSHFGAVAMRTGHE